MLEHGLEMRGNSTLRADYLKQWSISLTQVMFLIIHFYKIKTCSTNLPVATQDMNFSSHAVDSQFIFLITSDIPF